MQLNSYIAEASTLANKDVLNKVEERRFLFLLTAIPALRAGQKSLAEIENDYRNVLLAQLGEPPVIKRSKSEERSRLLKSLEEIGIKRGYREKVLAALRPDLS